MMNGDINPSWALAPRESRSMASKRRSIYQEGMEVDLKEEVVFGIGQRNMQRAAMLDMQRRVLAGDDPSLNSVLANIELDTLGQAKRIQNHLFDDGI